jgi:molybdenum cofactor cytidylyltransferase
MNAAKNPRLGIVILGAGASSRMGQPKLLLPWRGTTVIGHLISQWQQLGAAQIAVVMRAHDAAFAGELNRLNFSKSERIENPQPERGMFSSIVCAASWTGWRPEISSWAVVLGDQPHLRSETLRELLVFSARHPEAICQPTFEGHARHPVILPCPAFEELKHSGAATLKDFLKLSPQSHVQCPVADAGLSLDMDRPEDYRQLVNSN